MKIIQKIEQILAQEAIKKLRSLPDGAEKPWSFFLGRLSRCLIRFSLLNYNRWIQRFVEIAQNDGYIVDISNCDCLVGGEIKPIFRVKEKLLNNFAGISEKAIFSASNNVYFIKELWENRNGKIKQLQLYRIPHNLSTGEIRVQPQTWWITVIVLDGVGMLRQGVVTKEHEYFPIEDQEYELWEYDDESICIENY